LRRWFEVSISRCSCRTTVCRNGCRTSRPPISRCAACATTSCD
jgi:hypothetical protein